LGDRKSIWPLKKLGQYWFVVGDDLTARLIAPVITITSIILSSNKIQNGDIPVPAYQGCPGKWPLKSNRNQIWQHHPSWGGENFCGFDCRPWSHMNLHGTL